MKKALEIKITGVVQGVGFRPFVFRLAEELSLSGYVLNTPYGVELYLEGEDAKLSEFLKRLSENPPPLAVIYKLEFKEVPLKNFKGFQVLKGASGGEVEQDLLSDLAICSDCERELFDRENRRFRYPFIACTNCGPRFSIIERLPYERENTTMRIFPLCKACQEEYEDPRDRRFHAEPIACSLCGPHLELYSQDGKKLAEKEEALELAREFLFQGKILAVKGLTGFHLMGRADLPEVIETLRKRKRRSLKPFAVMFGEVAFLKEYVELTEEDLKLLLSPRAPILLLPDKGRLPKNLNEGLNLLGVFLPYTPLHKLLLKDLPFPVIATSGNLSDEPLVFENEEAFSRLTPLCDYLLLHNRPIKRGLDDSVIKRAGRHYIFIRRARGYVSLPIFIPFSTKGVILSLGAQEKNTFALAFKNKIILSQHLGDLDDFKSISHFERTLNDFLDLYRLRPEFLVFDLHPRYETTRWGLSFCERKGLPYLQLQHHAAHIYSVLAERGIFAEERNEEVLGIAFDGTGYGLDGTIWGCEFLRIKGTHFERVFSLRPFRLLGGEKAVKDTRRVALSLLFEIYGEEALNLSHPLLQSFKKVEIELLYQAWLKGINAPLCSSCGRLFDAVSALLGVCYYNTYSGEAPMRLESLYQENCQSILPFTLKENFYLDWEELIRELVEKRPSPEIGASAFIKGLARAVLEVAELFSIERVALSGGVFMNGPLLLETKGLLEKRGFQILLNEKVPPNDGGISLGQAYYGALVLKE